MPDAEPRPQSHPHPQRSDALKNREAILQVAHDALAESGNASLNSIAKRAGVGPGTLYRHFPTREALILAVYRHDIDRLVASVPDLLAAHADAPLDALRQWFLTLARYVRIKHGLGDALNSAATQEVTSATWPPVSAAVRELLDACERSGDVRPGLDPVDVVMLLGCLWRTPETPEGAAQAERLLELAIAGMQP
ncbi:transcriptional regulator, TetR family [Actinacidiphila alni]|uniref:Transcriptional regulator, TetR family n=1 Tax=Actinacidiphila alni TaxID=380248 RepID=A0A1I2D6X6_9ACTN|nr:TetR/AcrR family transcriptional regulator [Actinacidiphila alni]SFE76287.1 transcriptional regulator, TetR family [Actinacidiphila alni]